LLGAIWNSAMFPGRAPECYHLLTCFLGGQLDPGAYELEKDALRDLILEELGRCFGLKQPLEGELVNVRHWPRALPIFHVGYPAHIQRLRDALPPWLTLASNYLEAISVPECVRQAGFAAERVAAHVNASAPSAPAASSSDASGGQ
jgi:oxygen-dependent protoporphyrinogen oxidase